MDKEELIKVIIISVLVGLAVAFCTGWTEWWQILLCILGSAALLTILLLLAGLMLYVLFKKWWKEIKERIKSAIKQKCAALKHLFSKNTAEK